jgi:hypothetical protein
MLAREEARHKERSRAPLKRARSGSTVCLTYKEVDMRRKSISRILMTVTPIVIVLLASGVSAMAQSQNGQCSNQTLFGDYGFALEGVILGPGLPLRGVVMQHYDGKGNLTQVDHVVTNGVPPPQEWTPGSGTYTVNPDCTGIAVINVPGNPNSPINLHFVVVRHGKEIHQVVDANAVTAVGTRVK